MIKLSDFDFDLPEKLIATRPISPRSSSRLLVAQGDNIRDHYFDDLPSFLNKGDRLVLNNTRVIPARLSGHRKRAGNVARIDVTLLTPVIDSGEYKGGMDHKVWRAMARPLRKINCDEEIDFGYGLKAGVIEKTDTDLVLELRSDEHRIETALIKAGTMPLPPYIASKRAPDARDNGDYQTIFARHSGAVAAPTASLHFDDKVLKMLSGAGVEISEVTLHVGAGTFLPVKVDDVTRHKMHAEWGQVTARAADEINETRAAGGRIIPVGTTALRLLESAVCGGILQPWSGSTDIFIYPGFRFVVSDGLVTNFHLPKSTLMMLVSALMGKQRVERIYQHAICQEYRFFSYGDASLLIP